MSVHRYLLSPQDLQTSLLLVNKFVIEKMLCEHEAVQHSSQS